MAYCSGHSTWKDDEALLSDKEERDDLVRGVVAADSEDTDVEAMLESGAYDEAAGVSNDFFRRRRMQGSPSLSFSLAGLAPKLVLLALSLRALMALFELRWSLLHVSSTLVSIYLFTVHSLSPALTSSCLLEFVRSVVLMCVNVWLLSYLFTSSPAHDVLGAVGSGGEKMRGPQRRVTEGRAV